MNGERRRSELRYSGRNVAGQRERVHAAELEEVGDQRGDHDHDDVARWKETNNIERNAEIHTLEVNRSGRVADGDGQSDKIIVILIHPLGLQTNKY